MPSKSKKQAKLMRAVAHGWKPSKIKGPTRAVAKEFVSADERRNKVTGYQGGGMAGRFRPAMRGAQNYRGVPPQRGALSAGRQGMAAPWQGRGPSPMGGGRPGMFGSGWGGRGPGGPGGPGGGRAGALQQMMQRMRSQGGGGVLGGGNRGPVLSPYDERGQPPGSPGGQGPVPQQLDMQLPPFNRTPSGEIDLGGGRTPEWGPGGPGRFTQPTPGIHDTQDMSMGEGPGGRLEMEGRARQAKMRQMQQRGGPRGMMQQAQNRFGALTQGAPGGGSFGKRPPGRRIAPPPGKFPGGGNPNLGGRNPMMRGAGRFGGRGGRGGRGMFR